MEAGIAQVVVVLGYRAESLRPLLEAFPNAEAVLNLRYRTGRSNSIRAGLRQIHPQATDILVLGVDQPRSSTIVGKVMDVHQRMGSAITYPAYHGKGCARWWNAIGGRWCGSKWTMRRCWWT